MIKQKLQVFDEVLGKRKLRQSTEKAKAKYREGKSKVQR
jgi:hypothetical protein